MRKLLYGTTALATAGVFASGTAHAEGGIKLGLGGYMNNFFGVGDVDDDGNDFESTGMFSDREVEGDMQRAGKDKVTSGLGAVEYAVGPGITASLSGLYANCRGETGLDNQGFAGIAGINFRF